ncbi:TPA: hypothetical protein GRR52_25765 [Vibrio parahaemolyticus]|nr:hypothetical protein [Vibrio parahaemolyticus]
MFRANVRAFLARFCISNFSLSGLCKSGFGFLVSLARFLRRCLFQVVSVRDALKLRLI